MTITTARSTLIGGQLRNLWKSPGIAILTGDSPSKGLGPLNGGRIGKGPRINVFLCKGIGRGKVRCVGLAGEKGNLAPAYWHLRIGDQNMRQRSIATIGNRENIIYHITRIHLTGRWDNSHIDDASLSQRDRRSIYDNVKWTLRSITWSICSCPNDLGGTNWESVTCKGGKII